MIEAKCSVVLVIVNIALVSMCTFNANKIFNNLYNETDSLLYEYLFNFDLKTGVCYVYVCSKLHQFCAILHFQHKNINGKKTR